MNFKFHEMILYFRKVFYKIDSNSKIVRIISLLYDQFLRISTLSEGDAEFTQSIREQFERCAVILEPLGQCLSKRFNF